MTLNLACSLFLSCVFCFACFSLLLRCLRARENALGNEALRSGCRIGIMWRACACVRVELLDPGDEHKLEYAYQQVQRDDCWRETADVHPTVRQARVFLLRVLRYPGCSLAGDHVVCNTY